jgi:hypothetical protein
MWEFDAGGIAGGRWCDVTRSQQREGGASITPHERRGERTVYRIDQLRPLDKRHRQSRSGGA